MTIESPQIKPEESGDEDTEQRSPEQTATGPFADVEPGEPEVDLAALLEQLDAARNPDEKIDVAAERERVGGRLEQVAKRIEKEKGKNDALGAARQQLGVPHEGGETLKSLEEARDALEEEQRRIELAGEYNDVLGSFSELSREDIAHIAETGKTIKGESVKNKHGREIRSGVAKELAHMYLSGGRHITWGRLGELWELEKMAEQILHDVASVAKGMFAKREGGEKGNYAERQK